MRTHQQRRRIVHPILRNALQHKSYTCQRIRTIINEAYIPILANAARKGQLPDISSINDALAVDIITDFFFGEYGTNLLRDPVARQQFLRYHHLERSYGYWQQYYPTLVASAAKIGYPKVSPARAQASQWLDRWFEDAYTKATATSGSKPLRDLHRYLGDSVAEIAEIHDLCVAGYETVGQMLTFAMQELSRNKDIESQLHEELVGDRADGSPIATDLQQPDLRYSIIVETLRLRDRGPLPGVSLDHPVVLGSFVLPSRTRVSIPSYSSHHTSYIFASPDEWNPMRWLTSSLASAGCPEKGGVVGKFFVTFGSGHRQCVGREFAIYEVRHVLGAVYSRFETQNRNGRVQFYLRKKGET